MYNFGYKQKQFLFTLSSILHSVSNVTVNVDHDDTARLHTGFNS